LGFGFVPTPRPESVWLSSSSISPLPTLDRAAGAGRTDEPDGTGSLGGTPAAGGALAAAAGGGTGARWRWRRRTSLARRRLGRRRARRREHPREGLLELARHLLFGSLGRRRRPRLRARRLLLDLCQQVAEEIARGELRAVRGGLGRRGFGGGALHARQAATHRDAELLVVEWLGERAVGARGGLFGAVEDEHPGPAAGAREAGQQLAGTGHRAAEHHQIGGGVAARRQGTVAIAHHVHRPTLGRESTLDPLAVGSLLLDDEDQGHARLPNGNGPPL
jgi:hypothetical protein